VYNFVEMAFQLAIINFAVGIISFPISHLLFKKLSDKGYAIAHLLGWLCISYISFLLAHLGVPVYYSTYLSVLIWFSANFLIELKLKPVRSHLSMCDILTAQSIFLLFATVLYFIRIGDFRLNMIERTPDFGIIRSLFNATTLPLADVWLAGKTVNYYYFGHFTAFTIMLLSGLDPVAGFFYVVMWMFGTYALCLYGFGKNLYLFLTAQYLKPFLKGKFLPTVSGFLSVFLVLFAGNLYSAQYLWKTNFFFWNPTRFVEGVIMEISIFSFLVSDLHGHMWGLAVGILVLYTLLVFWFQTQTPPLHKNYYVYFLAFLLGLAIITNTWDIVSLGLLVGVMVGVRYIQHPFTLKNVATFFLCGLIVVGISLPWLLSYTRAGPMGLGVASSSSGPWSLFLHWGGFLIPFLLLLALYPSKLRKNFSFIHLVFFVSFLLVVFTEYFYIKDVMYQGSFQRANTVFKIYIQVWLWLGAVTGPILALLVVGRTIVGRFLALLILVALATYPFLTLKQTVVPKFSRSVYAGMNFFSDAYPADYQAFLFLKSIQDSLPNGKKQKILVEAPGESFKDQSLFSSYLGWPTILGWSGHVWLYRGVPTYSGERSIELNEIYTGINALPTTELLRKYHVDYIIIGTVEKQKYPNLNLQKLLSLGNKIYDKDGVIVLSLMIQ